MDNFSGALDKGGGLLFGRLPERGHRVYTQKDCCSQELSHLLYAPDIRSVNPTFFITGIQIWHAGYSGIDKVGYSGINKVGYSGINKVGYSGINKVGYSGIDKVGYSGIDMAVNSGIDKVGYPANTAARTSQRSQKSLLQYTKKRKFCQL